MGESTQIKVGEGACWWGGLWTAPFYEAKERALSTPTPKWRLFIGRWTFTATVVTLMSAFIIILRTRVSVCHIFFLSCYLLSCCSRGIWVQCTVIWIQDSKQTLLFVYDYVATFEQFHIQGSFCSEEKNLLNRPFPLTSKYVWNPWRHVWGASEGLLGWIFHCYIRECSLRSDGCCLRIQENLKLLRRQPRVPASAFSTVVVWSLYNFFQHCRGAVRWTCLVRVQRFVVAIECLLTS